MRNMKRKLTAKQRETIRGLRENGKTIEQLALIYGVSPNTIRNVTLRLLVSDRLSEDTTNATGAHNA